ncbi:hypothetical protein [Streptomyces adustus]
MASRVEKYLAHLDRLSGGREPRFFPVESTKQGLRGVTEIVYDGLPDGLLTTLTYGLSLAEHPGSSSTSTGLKPSGRAIGIPLTCCVAPQSDLEASSLDLDDSLADFGRAGLACEGVRSHKINYQGRPPRLSSRSGR